MNANSAERSTLARVRALADQWNATPDYTPSAYDQGRVDQRHEMTAQLLDALETDPPPDDRTIDPCPRCAAEVNAVEVPSMGPQVARPCGHNVAAIMWPHRIELT